MRLRLMVKEVAASQGLNQSTLARKADIDFTTVKRLFRDPYRDVAISTLYKVALALNVTVDALIERED